MQANIHLIGYYGRFDDLYFLMNTCLEDAMWKYVRELFKQDEYDKTLDELDSILGIKELLNKFFSYV